MRAVWSTIAAVCLIAVGVLGASAFTGSSDDPAWRPANGTYAFRQLAHRLPGDEERYLPSGCFVAVEPIQQRIVWDTGQVRVYTGSTMSCIPGDVAFTERDWTMTITSERSGTMREDSGHTEFAPPWEPLGGTVQMATYSFPCRAITPGRAGELGWVKAELSVTMTDTDGREWQAIATDYDGVICRPHRG